MKGLIGTPVACVSVPVQMPSRSPNGRNGSKVAISDFAICEGSVSSDLRVCRMEVD